MQFKLALYGGEITYKLIFILKIVISIHKTLTFRFI